MDYQERLSLAIKKHEDSQDRKVKEANDQRAPSWIPFNWLSKKGSLASPNKHPDGGIHKLAIPVIEMAVSMMLSIPKNGYYLNACATDSTRKLLSEPRLMSHHFHSVHFKLSNKLNSVAWAKNMLSEVEENISTERAQMNYAFNVAANPDQKRKIVHLSRDEINDYVTFPPQLTRRN